MIGKWSTDNIAFNQTMSLISKIRDRLPRLARASGALFVVFWIGLAAAPCALAMLVPETGHDCPHCPPVPCHEVQSDDCDYSESLDAPRASEKSPLEILAVLPSDLETTPGRPIYAVAIAVPPPARAGPRLHLVHTRFDE